VAKKVRDKEPVLDILVVVTQNYLRVKGLNKSVPKGLSSVASWITTKTDSTFA